MTENKGTKNFQSVKTIGTLGIRCLWNLCIVTFDEGVIPARNKPDQGCASCTYNPAEYIALRIKKNIFWGGDFPDLEPNNKLASH